MPSTPPPLWDGYDEAGGDKLEALLDEKVARDFAQAIASHEWLKQKLGASDYHPSLHAEANRIRSADIGSWRPK